MTTASAPRAAKVLPPIRRSMSNALGAFSARRSRSRSGIERETGGASARPVSRRDGASGGAGSASRTTSGGARTAAGAACP